MNRLKYMLLVITLLVSARGYADRTELEQAGMKLSQFLFYLDNLYVDTVDVGKREDQKDKHRGRQSTILIELAFEQTIAEGCQQSNNEGQQQKSCHTQGGCEDRPQGNAPQRQKGDPQQKPWDSAGRNTEESPQNIPKPFTEAVQAENSCKSIGVKEGGQSNHTNGTQTVIGIEDIDQQRKQHKEKTLANVLLAEKQGCLFAVKVFIFDDGYGIEPIGAEDLQIEGGRITDKRPAILKRVINAAMLGGIFDAFDILFAQEGHGIVGIGRLCLAVAQQEPAVAFQLPTLSSHSFEGADLSFEIGWSIEIWSVHMFRHKEPPFRKETSVC